MNPILVPFFVFFLLFLSFPASAETVFTYDITKELRAKVSKIPPNKMTSEQLLTHYSPVLSSVSTNANVDLIGTPSIRIISGDPKKAKEELNTNDCPLFARVWDEEAIPNNLGPEKSWKCYFVNKNHATLFRGVIKKDVFVPGERKGEKKPAWHLVYRFHFPRLGYTPKSKAFSLLGAHNNAGMLVIVTIDEKSKLPLYLNTVHTCGCYMAIKKVIPAEKSLSTKSHVLQKIPHDNEIPFAPGDRFYIKMRSGDHRVTYMGTIPPKLDFPEETKKIETKGIEDLDKIPIVRKKQLSRGGWVWEWTKKNGSLFYPDSHKEFPKQVRYARAWREEVVLNTAHRTGKKKVGVHFWGWDERVLIFDKASGEYRINPDFFVVTILLKDRTYLKNYMSVLDRYAKNCYGHDKCSE